MFLDVGNKHAVEGYRDEGQHGDEVYYRALPGERVTHIEFPEGTGLQESFEITINVLGSHMVQTEEDPILAKKNPAVPQWIESDSPGLLTLVQDYFELKDNQLSRPASWGKLPR